MDESGELVDFRRLVNVSFGLRFQPFRNSSKTAPRY
jgi:hypothetical protein